MSRSLLGRRSLVAVIPSLTIAALPAGASAKVRVFPFTGTEQRFKVPKGVKKIRVVAIGGRGGLGVGGGPGASDTLTGLDTTGVPLVKLTSKFKRKKRK